MKHYTYNFDIVKSKALEYFKEQYITSKAELKKMLRAWKLKNLQPYRVHLSRIDSQSLYSIILSNIEIHYITFKCEICNKEFQHEYNYKAHLLEKHKIGETPYFCSLCSKKFQNEYNLQAHLITKHDSKVVPQNSKEAEAEVSNGN